MGVLFDLREEKFAQFCAQGLEPKDARTQAGYPKSGKWSVKKLMAESRVRERIDALMERAASRAVLTRMEVLDGVLEEWRLARAVSQHGAALKAAEMYGGELHGMFRKQLEVGKVGDFDGQSEQELRAYIEKQMKELGMETPSAPQSPKLIEATVISQDHSSAEPNSDSIDAIAER